MLNFRYHVVSLVAVFLALAIGVVMGYGILGQPTVETLENRVKTVNRRVDETRAENQRLREELDRANSTLEAMAPFAGTDRLPTASIVVVAVRDVDSDVVESTVTLARGASADVPGVVWLESKLALREDSDVADLAAALGTSVTRRSTLRQAAYGALVTRLADGPPDAGDDVLARLTAAEFVTLEGVGDGDESDLGVAEVGGFGTRVLFADANGDSALPVNVIGLFARAAVDVSLPLVVAEDHDDEQDGDRGTLLDPVRDTDALASQVSTVDDLERVDGRTAAVLALADLGRNVVGHYGFGDGASRALPEWWPA